MSFKISILMLLAGQIPNLSHATTEASGVEENLRHTSDCTGPVVWECKLIPSQSTLGKFNIIAKVCDTSIVDTSVKQRSVASYNIRAKQPRGHGSIELDSQNNAARTSTINGKVVSNQVLSLEQINLCPNARLLLNTLNASNSSIKDN